MILYCMSCMRPLTAEQILAGRNTCSAPCQRKKLHVRNKLRRERICERCGRSRVNESPNTVSRAFRMSCQR